MYAPAVAVAQTLANPYFMEETQEDCGYTYVQDYSQDAALREAVAPMGSTPSCRPSRTGSD